MTTLTAKRTAVEAEWENKLDDDKAYPTSPRLTMDAGMTQREKLQAVKAAWKPLHDGSVLIQDEDEDDDDDKVNVADKVVKDKAPVVATGNIVKTSKGTTTSPTTPFLAIAVAVIAFFCFFWPWN